VTDPQLRLATALADRYRVQRELGAGGMATVYLAHDVRHERDVAIKVLHPDLGAALGAERFLSEIRTTARLQHPHILPLLDSGEADGLLFYVMPFIAGETLRAKLDRERQLAIDEAVALGREIADALQHAHDAGIVHRDIKPDNILLQGGHAVVADFGIALAVQQAAGQRLTQTGLSLGTPQYMAPEQATGERTIDARADVYALGAVVYEMLTGEPPFAGATSQAVVARLLTVAPPPIRQVRDTVPVALEEAVMRALAKLPADRFASARTFAETMQRALGTSTVATAISASTVAPSRLRDPLFVGLAALTAITVGWSGYAALRPARADGTRMTAAVLPLELRNPANVPLNEIGRQVAIANDGAFVVYVGVDPADSNATLLWRRDLDKLTAVPIAGTRNAQSPRVSEDSKTVYFLTRTPDGLRNVQRSIPAEGGAARDLMFQSSEVFVDLAGRMLRFDSTSGRVDDVSDQPQTTSNGIAQAVRVPNIPSTSPDGLHTLVVWYDSVFVHKIGEASRHVIGPGTWARFVDDHTILLSTPANVIMAARLNGDRTGLATKPVPVLESVARTPSQRPALDVSADGTAIYQTGGDIAASRLQWVRRDGRVDSIIGAEARAYTQVRLSPNGRDVATNIGQVVGQSAVWVERLGENRRVPISETNNGSVTWTSDGRTVAYPRARQGSMWGYTVMSRSADAVGAEDTLAGPWPPDRLIAEVEISASGAQIVRTMFAARLDRDLWGRTDSRSAFFKVAADSGVQERAARFSPDGKWVSFVSDLTKREEVYVQPFPGGGRYQVSANGGREPTWSRDGRALYYRALDGWMMEVPVNGSIPNFGQPRRLFDAAAYASNPFFVSYDVAPDGRFLMWKRVAQSSRTDVVIIRNWIAWVRQQIDASK
jgi:serine/threonine-protein kinase